MEYTEITKVNLSADCFMKISLQSKEQIWNTSRYMSYMTSNVLTETGVIKQVKLKLMPYCMQCIQFSNQTPQERTMPGDVQTSSYIPALSDSTKVQMMRNNQTDASVHINNDRLGNSILT